MRNLKLNLTAALGMILFAAVALNGSDWAQVTGSSLKVIVANTADINALYSNLDSRLDTETADIAAMSYSQKLTALALRMETILEQVQALTGNAVSFTGREQVVVVRDREDLQNLYAKFYGKRNERAISFYSPSRKTVFTCPEAMSARILAHELTHMVNDLATNGSMAADQDENLAYHIEMNF